jgi:hypothetical protein
MIKKFFIVVKVDETLPFNDTRITIMKFEDVTPEVESNNTTHKESVPPSSSAEIAQLYINNLRRGPQGGGTRKNLRKKVKN